MAPIVLMTSAGTPAEDVAPALSLLGHRVRTVTADLAALAEIEPGSVVLVDARRDLVTARNICRAAAATTPGLAVIVVVTEGGLTAISPDWQVTDVVLGEAGPAEFEARLRLAGARVADAGPAAPASDGVLTIDASGYTARLRGVPLDLTYKEFELLKHLHSEPDHVFTRAQILDTVWGHDYYGGTRTVDVHVRRLRAKLGPEHEGLIGTVRNVGYRYVSP